MTIHIVMYSYCSISFTINYWYYYQSVVFLQTEDGSSYMYNAIVDIDLNFKEMYSGYTSSVISNDDPYYQLIIS